MGGVGHGPIEQDDLGVREDARLLDNALAGHRGADLPHGAKQIKPDVRRAMQQWKAFHRQIAGPGRLSNAHGNRRALYPQLRQPPSAIDQRVGDENMEHVHNDHGVHRRSGVAGPLQDRGEHLQQDRERNH